MEIDMLLSSETPEDGLTESHEDVELVQKVLDEIGPINGLFVAEEYVSADPS
jgi:hypothetical protein